ncbi:MAG: phenazine biosynthesis protein PhzF [Gammaproteobacteria bacterium]|nr:phenazine biosynthesis protein PhzF [Gammaproteobacteria bacterium]
MLTNHVKGVPVLKYHFYIADVFTRQIFHGAQIAVFPHAEGLTRDRMQLIAREMNLSESVFVFPSTQGGNHRRIRVFSPHTEIDFAGHPIIATGMVLATTGDIKLEGKHTALELEQNVGPVSVNITQADGKPELIQFSRRIKPVIDRFVPPPEQLVDMLDLRAIDLAQKKFQPLLVYADQSYLIIPIRTYAAVRDARFNYRAWSESSAPDVHHPDRHAAIQLPCPAGGSQYRYA